MTRRHGAVHPNRLTSSNLGAIPSQRTLVLPPWADERVRVLDALPLPVVLAGGRGGGGGGWGEGVNRRAYIDDPLPLT